MLYYKLISHVSSVNFGLAEKKSNGNTANKERNRHTTGVIFRRECRKYRELFFICACPVIFFDFLQSDWLQQRAAFYDILTVVQKSYFFRVSEGNRSQFILMYVKFSPERRRSK
jgi:hypothetical protein